MSISRRPPSDILRQLRKEVNYGCPVPGCGSPFLEWHHFDPVWAERIHHDKNGMIGLCPVHHAMADNNLFSTDDLRNFKINPNPISFNINRFPWQTQNCLIRLGGCYAPNWCRITISGHKMIEIINSNAPFKGINFELYDEMNKLLARMQENILIVESNSIYDLRVLSSGSKITIWTEKRKIGFECEYKYIEVAKLENIIKNDTPNIKEPKSSGCTDSKSPKLIKNPEEYYNKLRKLNSLEKEIIPLGYEQNDLPGTLIRWNAAKIMDSNYRIPFLNFKRFRMFYNQKLVELGGGKVKSNNMDIQFCFGNTFGFR